MLILSFFFFFFFFIFCDIPHWIGEKIAKLYKYEFLLTLKTGFKVVSFETNNIYTIKCGSLRMILELILNLGARVWLAS